MNSQIVVLPSDATMQSALTRFLNESAELLTVVDKDQSFVGIVSESDLLAVAADGQRRSDPISLYVNRQYVGIDESAPLETVIDQFVLHRVRCLPVVSGRRIVGLIHRRDVLRYLHLQSASIFSVS